VALDAAQFEVWLSGAAGTDVLKSAPGGGSVGSEMTMIRL
jgi:hypothetical protein